MSSQDTQWEIGVQNYMNKDAQLDSVVTDSTTGSILSSLVNSAATTSTATTTTSNISNMSTWGPLTSNNNNNSSSNPISPNTQQQGGVVNTNVPASAWPSNIPSGSTAVTSIPRNDGSSSAVSSNNPNSQLQSFGSRSVPAPNITTTNVEQQQQQQSQQQTFRPFMNFSIPQPNSANSNKVVSNEAPPTTTSSATTTNSFQYVGGGVNLPQPQSSSSSSLMGTRAKSGPLTLPQPKLGGGTNSLFGQQQQQYNISSSRTTSGPLIAPASSSSTSNTNNPMDNTSSSSSPPTTAASTSLSSSIAIVRTATGATIQVPQPHHQAPPPPPSSSTSSWKEHQDDVSGINVLNYTTLAAQDVETLGRCTITNIRTEYHTPNATYYCEGQRDTIVTGVAILHRDGSRHRVQRIMVGQLWMDFVRNKMLGGHSVGRLLSFIANEPITIFGMIPQEAIKNKQTLSHAPSMVGFWLSIDSIDHPDTLVDLQRATILFSKKGILAAFSREEHRRLLEIADARRCAGNTGLPESPMTLEAAKNAPKRSTGDKDADVYRYHPPKNHPYPQPRRMLKNSSTSVSSNNNKRNNLNNNMGTPATSFDCRFQPFVTRWDLTATEEDLQLLKLQDPEFTQNAPRASVYQKAKDKIPFGFALVGCNTSELSSAERRLLFEPNSRRCGMAKIVTVKTEDCEGLEVHETSAEPTWC